MDGIQFPRDETLSFDKKTISPRLICIEVTCMIQSILDKVLDQMNVENVSRMLIIPNFVLDQYVSLMKVNSGTISHLIGLNKLQISML